MTSSKLSHSSITTYNDCPKKFYFRYILKIPEKPKHYFSFGKAVHAALEAMYSSPCRPNLTALLQAYDSAWSSEGYKDKPAEKKAHAEGEVMISKYYEINAPGWTPCVSTEMRFDVVIEGVRLTGFIDRVDSMPGDRIHIIDYKTGRELEPGREAGDEQLTMYQLACETMGLGKVGSVSLVHVPTARWATASRHGEELVSKLISKIVHTAGAIADGKYIETPSEDACKWCDYKRMCPAWGTVSSM